MLAISIFASIVFHSQIIQKKGNQMADQKAPVPYGATPTKQQLAWQKTGMYAFIHFTVNTFTGREWGDGTEPEDVFHPTEMDCEQWCRIINGAGFKGIVLTAKHHDGFCLWPSKYTTHSVKYSKWRDGKGDVVGDLAKAAKKYGLKLGLYLSPWDRHEKTYGSGDAYNEFYRNQLRELLTTYGGKNGEDIFITWFDGACGEGPNGKVQVYDYDKAAAVIRECAPNAVIFGHMGDHRDIRWCGNERGYAGSPNWATLNEYRDAGGDGGLQHGHVNGKHWWPSEVDVSIRPGWFYHKEQDSQVHSLEHLLDIWYHSVGRGSCLNLNFPPDRRGLIHEIDAERIHEFKIVLDKTFRTNFAAGARVAASNERGADFSGDKMTDGSPDTFWAPEDGMTECEAVIELGGIRRLNVISLKEYTQLGQRVAEFTIEYKTPCGQWKKLIDETTISFSRILRTETVETDALKLKITKALACPCIQEFSAYYQPPLTFAPSIVRDADGIITLIPPNDGVRIHYTLDGALPTAESPEYTGPFQVREAGFLRAVSLLKPGVENAYPEIKSNPEANLRFGTALKDWKVIAADSQFDDNNKKEHIITADDHIWLTARDVPYPHWITIDTARKQTIHGFIFTPPKATECGMGPVYRYRFLVGDSPDQIDTVAAEGTFDNILNNPVPQIIELKKPIEARYIRFEALESANGACYANVKRIELF